MGTTTLLFVLLLAVVLFGEVVLLPGEELLAVVLFADVLFEDVLFAVVLLTGVEVLFIALLSATQSPEIGL